MKKTPDTIFFLSLRIITTYYFCYNNCIFKARFIKRIKPKCFALVKNSGIISPVDYSAVFMMQMNFYRVDLGCLEKQPAIGVWLCEKRHGCVLHLSFSGLLPLVCEITPNFVSHIRLFIQFSSFTPIFYNSPQVSCFTCEITRSELCLPS